MVNYCALISCCLSAELPWLLCTPS